MKTNLSTSPCPLHQCRHCGAVIDPMVSETVENMQLGEPALLKSCGFLLSKKGKKILDEHIGEQSELPEGYSYSTSSSVSPSTTPSECKCICHRKPFSYSIGHSWPKSCVHCEPTQDSWSERFHDFLEVQEIFFEFKKDEEELKDFISKELLAQRQEIIEQIKGMKSLKKQKVYVELDNLRDDICDELDDLLERLEK